MDVLERKAFMPEDINISEKLSGFRKNFVSAVTPENGSYGITRIDKGNGLEVIRGKNASGHPFIEYYQDGKLITRRESLGNHQMMKTNYDDAGIAYQKIITEAGKNTKYELAANATITKGNFTAITDASGRVVSTKVKDITLKDGGYHPVSKFRDNAYLDGDEVGHGVLDQFGGPAIKENTFAQVWEVNRGSGSKIRQVENLVARLKKEGHTVDYEMRANYSGTKNTRPTSFAPCVTVDGQRYELPKNLKKIYNISEETTMQKAFVDIKEEFGTANEVIMRAGVIGAGITFAISSMDNISACINGRISGEEAAVEILKDTATASGIAYGTAFVSTAIAETMKDSSKVLLQRVGSSCLPAAASVFAIDSAEAVIGFAMGKTDGDELVYELGDSVASIAGGLAGGSVGVKVGTTIGTIVTPGMGAVAGAVVGGVVGTVVASEIYATAVEHGTEGAKLLADKAETFAKNTVTIVKENIPEQVDEVKEALNGLSTLF